MLPRLWTLDRSLPVFCIASCKITRVHHSCVLLSFFHVIWRFALDVCVIWQHSLWTLLQALMHTHTHTARRSYSHKRVFSHTHILRNPLSLMLHERWISWFLASLKVAANCEMLVVWLARHIGLRFTRAAEHLTYWTLFTPRRFHTVSPLGVVLSAARLAECDFFRIQVPLTNRFHTFFLVWVMRVLCACFHALHSIQCLLF